MNRIAIALSKQNAPNEPAKISTVDAIADNSPKSVNLIPFTNRPIKIPNELIPTHVKFDQSLPA